MKISVEHVPLDKIPAGVKVWDFTTINDIQTCPKFGYLRRIRGLRPEGREAPALAAGSAVHKFCAAWNAWPILAKIPPSAPLSKIIENRLIPDVWTHFDPDKAQDADEEKRFYSRLEFATSICEASGFEDYENDTRRTIANIVAAGISWATNMEHYKTFVGPCDADNDIVVGVEQAFCLKFVIDDMPIYYGGIIDNIRLTKAGQLQFVDYKTTGMAFRDDEPTNSHQFTGYWLYLAILGQRYDIPLAPSHRKHKIHIPPLKASYDSQRSYAIHREERYLTPFFSWLLDGLVKAKMFDGATLDLVPMYTHSCMRFMRPCMYAAFCDAPIDDQEAELSEMIEDFWSPIPEAANSGSRQ